MLPGEKKMEQIESLSPATSLIFQPKSFISYLSSTFQNVVTIEIIIRNTISPVANELAEHRVNKEK